MAAVRVSARVGSRGCAVSLGPYPGGRPTPSPRAAIAPTLAAYAAASPGRARELATRAAGLRTSGLAQ
jgi:hypothetical protein